MLEDCFVLVILLVDTVQTLHALTSYVPFPGRVNETEFMQFSEVENHDDFYSFTSDYHVRSCDPIQNTL